MPRKHHPIQRPSHYTQGKIEVADFLDDKNLDHHSASAIEYICRAPYKGSEEQDLGKAIWRLQRRLKVLRYNRRYPHNKRAN